VDPDSVNCLDPDQEEGNLDTLFVAGVDPDPNPDWIRIKQRRGSGISKMPGSGSGRRENLCTLFVVSVERLVLLVQHKQHLLHQLKHLLHI
jgi:hypothetical protein